VGAVPRYLAWRKHAHKARPRRSPGYPRLRRSRLNSRRFGGTTCGRACVNRSRGGRERWPRRHLLVVINSRTPSACRELSDSRQADRVGAKWRTSIPVAAVIVLAEPRPTWMITATAHREPDHPSYRDPDHPRRLRPSRAMVMITLCECKVYVGFRYYRVRPACPRHIPHPHGTREEVPDDCAS
jgi:hypothetical protein